MKTIANLSYRQMVLFLIILGLDRGSKSWALAQLAIDRVYATGLRLALTFNTGVCWGWGSSVSSVILVLLAALLIWWVWRQLVWRQQRSLDVWAEVLILAGASSNLYDRLLYAGVIDFIVLDFGVWSWPAFNVADLAIVFGVFWMIWIGYAEQQATLAPN